MTPRNLAETEDGFLFPGESPADLIGFSIIADKKKKVLYYYMIRVPIKNRASVARQVKKLIKKLQGPQVTLTEAAFAKFEKPMTKQNSDSQNWNLPNVFYGPINGARKQYEYKMPLMEVYRPTLFIYTTNIKGAKFVKNYIVPKSPSRSLDPYCSNLRLWDNDEVMGLYSQYDCNVYPDKSEYWYNLVIDGPQKGMNFGQYFDPGNGNGSGSEFP